MLGFLRRRETVRTYYTREEKEERLRRSKLTLDRMREMVEDMQKVLDAEKETRE